MFGLQTTYKKTKNKNKLKKLKRLRAQKRSHLIGKMEPLKHMLVGSPISWNIDFIPYHGIETL
jgi:hypothetical protein